MRRKSQLKDEMGLGGEVRKGEVRATRQIGAGSEIGEERRGR